MKANYSDIAEACGNNSKRIIEVARMMGFVAEDWYIASSEVAVELNYLPREQAIATVKHMLEQIGDL